MSFAETFGRQSLKRLISKSVSSHACSNLSSLEIANIRPLSPFILPALILPVPPQVKRSLFIYAGTELQRLVFHQIVLMKHLHASQACTNTGFRVHIP